MAYVREFQFGSGGGGEGARVCEVVRKQQQGRGSRDRFDKKAPSTHANMTHDTGRGGGAAQTPSRENTSLLH